MERKTLEMNAADLARGGEAEEQSERGTEERKEKRFGEQLADQARAAGAERRSDSHFAQTRSAAGEKDIFDVHAGQQQDESGEDEEEASDGDEGIIGVRDWSRICSESTVTVDHLSVAGYWAASRAVMTSTED